MLGHSPGTVRGELGAEGQVQAVRRPLGLTIPGRELSQRERVQSWRWPDGPDGRGQLAHPAALARGMFPGGSVS